MRFLYVAISYPDVAKNTNMYSDLIHGLSALGHELRVIAPTFDSETQASLEGGIPVLRVKSGVLFKTGVVKKGINTVLLNSRYARAMRRFWNDWTMDWVITSTPPITLSPFIHSLKKKWQARLYLVLRDIFPQNAKDLGMIRDPLLFAWFRRKERHLYKISDVIGCMSPGNIDFLRRQDPDLFQTEKLTYFPNWTRPTPRGKNPKGEGGFRERFGLQGKFIALFGGNFGKPQKIEFLLELARRVARLPDVVFCLIGDGTEKNRIRDMVKQQRLSNVLVLDRIPHDEYQSLIHDADIGLVNLSEKFTIPNIPSRTLGYWDAGLPVLAATDRNTDLNENLLAKYNAGLWAETGNLEQYEFQFMKLYANSALRKSMGENGRKAVETEFSLDSAVNRFLHQIH